MDKFHKVALPFKRNHSGNKSPITGRGLNRLDFLLRGADGAAAGRGLGGVVVFFAAGGEEGCAGEEKQTVLQYFLH